MIKSKYEIDDATESDVLDLLKDENIESIKINIRKIKMTPVNSFE
jgi:hypothetical protein